MRLWMLVCRIISCRDLAKDLPESNKPERQVWAMIVLLIASAT